MMEVLMYLGISVIGGLVGVGMAKIILWFDNRGK